MLFSLCILSVGVRYKDAPVSLNLTLGWALLLRSGNLEGLLAPLALLPGPGNLEGLLAVLPRRANPSPAFQGGRKPLLLEDLDDGPVRDGQF